MVKQELTRLNIDIVEISELKWTGMGEFNSDDHYIYYCGQESLRRNGVALIGLKCRTWCNLKNNRTIFVHFQSKPLQVYAPTTDAKGAEVDQFFEDLHDLVELTKQLTKKGMSLCHREVECKSRKSRDTWLNRQV